MRQDNPKQRKGSAALPPAEPFHSIQGVLPTFAHAVAAPCYIHNLRQHPRKAERLFEHDAALGMKQAALSCAGHGSIVLRITGVGNVAGASQIVSSKLQALAGISSRTSSKTTGCLFLHCT